MADVLAHPLTAPTQAGPSTHWSKNYRAVFSPMMLLLLVSSFTRQNSERMLTLRLINNNYNYTNASSYVIQFGHSPTREVWTQVEAVDVYHLSCRCISPLRMRVCIPKSECRISQNSQFREVSLICVHCVCFLLRFTDCGTSGILLLWSENKTTNFCSQSAKCHYHLAIWNKNLAFWSWTVAKS